MDKEKLKQKGKVLRVTERCVCQSVVTIRLSRGIQREYSSKPLKHSIVNVFYYLTGRYRHIFIPQKTFHLFGFPS